MTCWESSNIAVPGLDQLDILRQASFWKSSGGLAAVPLVLATIMPLVAHLVPQFLLPSLFRVSYTPDELVLLVILLVGASVGARKRFPTWSYTWVIMAIASVVALLTSALPSLFFFTDLRIFRLTWLIYLTHISGGFLALVFAASTANRGLTHPFFIAGVYLASIALRAYIQDWSPDLLPVAVVAANSFVVFITALELVIVLATVAHFLIGDNSAQRRSVYVLIGVALLDPVLTGWASAFESADTGEIVNVDVIFVGLQVLVRWVYIGVTLLLTWGLTSLFIKLRKINVTSPPPSGAAHAC